mmetsp:Transcript_27317/g.83017  ORF Transcript_27317/g.83017 Transcript_27317/m.83017 type:complete len:422 (-) Transcript_27317:765-2030(-)
MSSTDSSSALSLGWNSPTLPAAIGISIGAGLATAVGGAFAFLPGVWRALPQTTVLAISLALSAGVMLYVSFIEIFSKSHDAILASGVSEAAATGITTLCFFLGMGLTVLLELLVHVIFERRNAGCADAPSDLPTEICACHMDLEADEGGLPVLVHDNKEAVPPHHAHQHAHHHSHVQCTTNSMECAPAAAAGERTHPTPPSSNAAAAPIFVPSSSVQPSELQRIDEASVMVEMLSAPTHVSRTSSRNGEATPGTAEDSDHVALNSPEEKKRLARMGMMTALAIAIHNFPEGLATFLATLADAHVGASLGVAIAIHNIPEGLCVAMPVYYATESKWKAFGWALLSGLTEPIGGIAGYAILQPFFTEMVFGIVFSMVGGMMVFIVCHELLPAAHRYMGHQAKTTAWVVAGMAIMAASLVLFVI